MLASGDLHRRTSQGERAIGWPAGQPTEPYGLEVIVDANESFLEFDLGRRVLLFQSARGSESLAAASG